MLQTTICFDPIVITFNTIHIEVFAAFCAGSSEFEGCPLPSIAFFSPLIEDRCFYDWDEREVSVYPDYHYIQNIVYFIKGEILK